MLKDLRGKIVLIFIAITIGAVTVSTGYTVHMQKQFGLKRAKEQASVDLGLISNEIQTILHWVIKDLYVLRDLSHLGRFLETHDQMERTDALESIKRAFEVVATHHQIYLQIRYLDESGMEMVRVNFDGSRTTPVPASELQQKGHRYYFKEAITLQHGQVYISPLDLNVEHGVIERPYVPTIRYSTPVRDSQGKTRGIIVLNVLGAAILQVLERQQVQVRSHDRQYYLLNTQGYFLFHPDNTKSFGFMLGTGELLERYEPALTAWLSRSLDKGEGVAVQKSDSTGAETLFAFHRIPLWTGPLDHFSFGSESAKGHSTDISEIAPHKAYWILLSNVDAKNLLVGFEEYSKTFVFFTIFLLMGCVLVATVVGLLVSRPVVSLASAAGRIQDGDLSARAEIYSKDEMGQFGRLFNRMATKLEQSVNRLKASEKKYRQLFENSRDCFFVANNSGHIFDLNSSCAALLGLSHKDDIPANLSLPWYYEDSNDSEAFFDTIRAAGFVKDYEVHLKQSDGSHIVCLMTATTR